MSAELSTDGKRRHPRSPHNSFLRTPPPVTTPNVAAITNDGVRQQPACLTIWIDSLPSLLLRDVAISLWAFRSLVCVG
jgi:hypothetical protein